MVSSISHQFSSSFNQKILTNGWYIAGTIVALVLENLLPSSSSEKQLTLEQEQQKLSAMGACKWVQFTLALTPLKGVSILVQAPCSLAYGALSWISHCLPRTPNNRTYHQLMSGTTEALNIMSKAINLVAVGFFIDHFSRIGAVVATACLAVIAVDSTWCNWTEISQLRGDTDQSSERGSKRKWDAGWSALD